MKPFCTTASTLPGGCSALGWATMASWNSGLNAWPGIEHGQPGLLERLVEHAQGGLHAFDQPGGFGGGPGRGNAELQRVADIDHVGREALDRKPVRGLDVFLGPLADVFHLGEGAQLRLAGVLQLGLCGREFGLEARGGDRDLAVGIRRSGLLLMSPACKPSRGGRPGPERGPGAAVGPRDGA